ncbi:hypothetical protein GNF82_17205, partial [Clostridium perfringens]
MTTHRERAPLAEAIMLYRERGASSFHVPGHKNGRAYAGEGKTTEMLREAMRI